MLRWMSGKTRKDKVKDGDIKDNLGISLLEVTIREDRLRWFTHVRIPEQNVIRRVTVSKQRKTKKIGMSRNDLKNVT